MFAAFENLIFPGQVTQGRREAMVQPGPGCELVTLRSAGGVRVVALFGRALGPDGRPHPEAASRPTVLHFYGNGMCLAASLGEVALWRRLGTNVLVPDYPGYGLSGGRASEAGCYAAADAAYAHLRTRSGVDPARIVAAGWSLGGAVAIDLASREPVAGLVGLGTFTNLADVAQTHFPFLPAALLLGHPFASDRKIGLVRCPILLVHGTRDSVAPYALMSRLAGAARVPVARLSVAGADHDDLFLVGRDQIVASLGRFLEGL